MATITNNINTTMPRVAANAPKANPGPIYAKATWDVVVNKNKKIIKILFI